MSTNVLRTADGWWAVRGHRAVPVDTKAATTAELIADRAAVSEAALSDDAGTPVADLVALSPVTTPCRVVAQRVTRASRVTSRPPSSARRPVRSADPRRASSGRRM